MANRLVNEAADLVRYRGGPGHWSYLLHRATGLGVLAFLAIHIVDTAAIGFGPEVFNRIVARFRHPLFRLSEIFLFGAVLFHALNGVRLIVVDLWPGATRRRGALLWATGIAFAVLWTAASTVMIVHWARAGGS